MSRLPQSNARLLSVTRGEYSEDYDRPETVAAPVWQGNIDAYLQEKLLSTFNQGGELLRVVQVTIIISSDIETVLQTGDLLSYLPNSSGTPRAGKIQNVITPSELAYLSDYYKCALEPVNAP